MSELVRRRRLPHWDVRDAAYFVTSCLAGSMPATGRLDLVAYRQELQRRPRSKTMTDAEEEIRDWKLMFARTDRWLDAEPAVRWFDSADLATVAVDALHHFACQQYELLGYVVMPSHIHWVFRPLPDWVATLPDPDKARETIVKSRNQWVAHECNRLLKRKGAFWQHEGYDHWIRDSGELERILLYIENNPVKAGLVATPGEWRFSSAHERGRLGLELGVPLMRKA